MTTFAEYLGAEHAACDADYATAEQAVDRADWAGAEAAHAAFIAAMERHLNREEEVLFPAFEEASGSAMGPTQVMRHEHGQMRQLFATMTEALAAKDVDGYLGAGETLLILMQQHNAKEEQILYPMTDRVLGGQRERLLAAMGAVGTE